MKAMPLPFEDFQGTGVLDFSSSSSPDSLSQLPPQNQPHQQQKWQNSNTKENCCYVGSEPTSVLDARRSPSPPTSSSTLSSSQGGSNGGGGASTENTTSAAAAVSGYPSVDTTTEKCGQLGMEDWEGILPGSPSQEQSILRLIMGDVEDPTLGLNKLLQSGTGRKIWSSMKVLGHNAKIGSVLSQNPSLVNPTSAGNLLLGMFQHQQLPPIEATEEKPQIFNPQVITDQNPAQFGQNPAMFLPLSYAQLQELHLLSPPPTKRLSSGPIGANYELQQAILNPICQAAELIETGNPVLAQGILARLNHQLSLSIGKPHMRAAFYFKEALQLLLHMNNTTNPSSVSTCSLISKIGAYKSFSEISPILQFANFTCNQALLEACEGFDRIHVIDFDIGFGGQWASLMQELAMRDGGVPSLKITAFASPSSHDEVELSFTEENLRIFASEINMPFEVEILGLESLTSGSWSLPRRVSETEVIAVNSDWALFKLPVISSSGTSLCEAALT
ncbi:hypothetical protein GH714_018828 [Hevea brasiliensis]|uniref:Uncharacterized protein n=1 Tax=Hevea brasiliensis TaxID=3981 RepID=A0A6A6LPY2_HEVBR|nr:hypothetical protein GH714_018828 [Hevea brasiliensis]